MELIRRILFALEEHEHGYAPATLSIEGYTQEQIEYHAYLMLQAGLVEGVATTDFHSSSPSACLTSLTWEGHEFSATARNETVWKGAMKTVRERGGEITIELLKQLLTSLMKAQFSLS